MAHSISIWIGCWNYLARQGRFVLYSVCVFYLFATVCFLHVEMASRSFIHDSNTWLVIANSKKSFYLKDQHDLIDVFQNPTVRLKRSTTK